jgi:hypothetical protein
MKALLDKRMKVLMTVLQGINQWKTNGGINIKTILKINKSKS